MGDLRAILGGLGAVLGGLGAILGHFRQLLGLRNVDVLLVFKDFREKHYFLKIIVSKPSWTDLWSILGGLGRS